MNKKVQQSVGLRRAKVSAKVKAHTDRIRITVYKSLNYDYLQAIDDKQHKTIAGVTTKKVEGKSRMEKAEKLGETLAQILNEKKIKNVVFDRRGYKYHGRIKTIAESLRKNGINF